MDKDNKGKQTNNRYLLAGQGDDYSSSGTDNQEKPANKKLLLAGQGDHYSFSGTDKQEKQTNKKLLLAGQGDDYTSSGKGKEKANSQSQKAWPAPNSQGDQHGSKVVNGNNNGNRWFVRPRWG